MKMVSRQRCVRLSLTFAAVLSAGFTTSSGGSRPYLPTIGPSALRFDMLIRPTIAMALVKPSKPEGSERFESKPAERKGVRSSQKTPVLPATTANLLDIIEEPLLSLPGSLVSPDYSPLRPKDQNSTATLDASEGKSEEAAIPNVIPAPEKAQAVIPTQAFIQFFRPDLSTNKNTSGVRVAVPFSFEPPAGNESRPSSSSEFRKE